MLVLRNVTERPEGVEAGVARLVGMNKASIVAGAMSLLRDPGEYAAMARPVNPYGDGHASERIVDVLESVLGTRPALVVPPAHEATGSPAPLSGRSLPVSPEPSWGTA